jgi:pilus assembly protein CpaF
MEGDVITMQELFHFVREGRREDGKVIGRFQPTGIRPKFAETLHERGIELPGSLFLSWPPNESAGGERSHAAEGDWS